jgi:hypothetical protein
MASVCTLRSCLCRFTRRRVTTLPRWRARVLDWPRLYGLVLPGGSHVWALYTLDVGVRLGARSRRVSSCGYFMKKDKF